MANLPVRNGCGWGFDSSRIDCWDNSSSGCASLMDRVEMDEISSQSFFVCMLRVSGAGNREMGIVETG